MFHLQLFSRTNVFTFQSVLLLFSLPNTMFACVGCSLFSDLARDFETFLTHVKWQGTALLYKPASQMSSNNLRQFYHSFQVLGLWLCSHHNQLHSHIFNGILDRPALRELLILFYVVFCFCLFYPFSSIKSALCSHW